jgi:ribonuclease PH
MDGDLTQDMVEDCVELAKDGCRQLHEMQQDAMLEKYEALRGGEE